MKNRLKLLVWLFALSGPLDTECICQWSGWKIAAYGILPVSQRRSSYAVSYNGKQMRNLLPWGWRKMWVISIEDCS